MNFFELSEASLQLKQKISMSNFSKSIPVSRGRPRKILANSIAVQQNGILYLPRRLQASTADALTFKKDKNVKTFKQKQH